MKLTQNGISEQDILNIAAVFELESYSSLKSAIQELSEQYEKIRTELDSIQIQNRGIKADNQRISSSLVNSRHTFDILQDSKFQDKYLCRYYTFNRIAVRIS